MNARIVLTLLFLTIKRLYCQLNEQKCEDYAKDINLYRPTVSYKSPNPAGTWVSSRCEGIQYNKFIVRRFDIHAYTWSSVTYHYSDTWCTKPTFHVKMKGNYEVVPATATPNSKSSFSSRFHFQTLNVYTRSNVVLEKVINFILEKCPNALPSISRMQKGKILELDKFVNKNLKLEISAILKKRHCRYYFVLHPNTYKKIRMVGEDRSSRKNDYDMLYFGDISSFHTPYDPMYVSTTFQSGLSRVKRPGCDVCRKIIHNDVKKIDKPPVLKIPPLQKSFGGTWVSETCQADDDTTFFTKFYKFTYKRTKLLNSGKFTAQENLFSDVDCKVKKFVTSYGGTFRDVVQKRRDVYQVTLYIKWMTLAIYDDTTMSLVRNGRGCGDPTRWRTGVEQNVTATKGCRVLGFAIPATVKLLTRVLKTRTKQQLYEKSIDGNKETFFTSNLISCSYVTGDIKKRIPVTRPAPPKHIVPTIKIDINDYNNSAISRTSLHTSFYLIVCILYCLFYYTGISY